MRPVGRADGALRRRRQLNGAEPSFGRAEVGAIDQLPGKRIRNCRCSDGSPSRAVIEISRVTSHAMTLSILPRRLARPTLGGGVQNGPRRRKSGVRPCLRPGCVEGVLVGAQRADEQLGLGLVGVGQAVRDEKAHQRCHHRTDEEKPPPTFDHYEYAAQERPRCSRSGLSRPLSLGGLSSFWWGSMGEASPLAGRR